MDKLVETFVELAKIPSPSLGEDKVADKIIEILNAQNINAKKDDYGNVYAFVEPTDKSKRPLLLSAHMDVVGDDSPINIEIQGDIIQTDKTRTLGADDKAGVAAAIVLAKEIANTKDLLHGGLELVFTRDEEQGMSGIHNLDFSKLESEYILVLDSSELGKFEISGASYTKLDVTVKTKIGGHSGLDIAKKDRINAAKVIADYVALAPIGVINEDELGIVTSANLGCILGGGIERTLNSAQKSKNPIEHISQNCTDNVINTTACAHYSIRSSNAWFEKELIDAYKNIADEIKKKYGENVQITIDVSEHLKPFEKSDDDTLVNIGREAASKTGLKLDVSSFHAGAETHVYANEKNKYGKVFKPVLIGVADIENMHSVQEKLHINSYLEGYKFLKEFFMEFNA